VSLSDVVQGGYCIGCGACAVVDTKIAIKDNENGLPQAKLAVDVDSSAGSVCPFLSNGDEDSIGSLWFSRNNQHHHPFIGYYSNLYAGHVTEGSFRDQGGSSGMVTWVLVKLLEEGAIDGVIHVKPTHSGRGLEDLFAYGISYTVTDVRRAAKAKYYPTHFEETLREVKARQGNFAFVGVPCYVKAIRMLMEQDKLVADRVKFTIALFCGHMKTKQFAAFLADQFGVESKGIEHIDFRVKRPQHPANRYATMVSGSSGNPKLYACAPINTLFGLDWGLGYFKPRACDWCDDIVGEVADLSCGDAWLPAYIGDGRGANLVISRNTDLSNLIEQGRELGHLKLTNVSPQDIYTSQAGNYRHRREGLGERIRVADQSKVWHPTKRSFADVSTITWRRKRVYALRTWLAEYSQASFNACGGNSIMFAVRMLPYQVLYYLIVGSGAKGALKSAITFLGLIYRRTRATWL
jgi:coenzyme F420 hydrogenase subunit beta